MKSTVVPSLPGILITLSITAALMLGYISGRMQSNKEIKYLEAQYAEEDKKAAEAVTKLVEDLKADCELRINNIVNNMHSGS